MRFAVIIAVFGLAFCVNHHNLSLDQIGAKVVSDMDTNKDGTLSLAEIDQVLITHYDHDQNGCVSEHEFAHQWNKEYHDDNQSSRAFFRNLDINSDGCLDATDMSSHVSAMDGVDNDGVISVSEFQSFLHSVHPDRHHQHGHGQGVIG